MISDNQMISGRQASWIFMLDMLAAGLFFTDSSKGTSFIADNACGQSADNWSRADLL